MRDTVLWRRFWSLLIGVLLGWGLSGFYWHPLILVPLSLVFLAFVFAVTDEDDLVADS